MYMLRAYQSPARGTAWGEWGAARMQDLVGYVPAQLNHLSGLWNAPETASGTARMR